MTGSRKQLVAGAAALAACALLFLLLRTPPGSSAFLVGIIEPIQHIAVSDVTRGVKAELASNGGGFDIVVKNANGDKTAIPQIVAQYLDQKAAVLVPIFTSNAQAVRTAAPGATVVFAAVTDPVSAGLVADPKKPGKATTGVSDLWPIGANLDLVKQVVPAARRLGVVFDPGDPSSAVTMPLLRQEALSRGLLLDARPVTSTGEVPQALASLRGSVDVLFTANDVTVTAAFPALVSFAIEGRLPLFAGDYSSVERGAIGAVGQDYYNVGIEVGRLIRRIRAGTSPSELPIVYTQAGHLYLNRAAATQMGVTLPDELVRSAYHVYDRLSPDVSR